MKFISSILFLALCLPQTIFAVPDLAKLLESQSVWSLDAGQGVTTLDSRAILRASKDAAILLEYGFSSLTQAKLSKTGHGSLQIDLYEMIDSVAAFGIFSWYQPPSATNHPGLGNSSWESTTQLTFQQDRYVVVLACPEPISEFRNSVTQLAISISSSLPKEFSAPMVVKKLPTGSRIENSERFIMGPVAFSRLFPNLTGDSFGLSTGAEAALADYAKSGENARLLLIFYPTQQLAKKFLKLGYADLSGRYPNQSIFYKRDGSLVTLAITQGSPSFATSLLEEVSYVSLVTLDPKTEPPNIARVMLNIFIFCGIMLAMTLVVGILFGFVRVLLSRLFPGRFFDKPKNVAVIRLNLDAKDRTH